MEKRMKKKYRIKDKKRFYGFVGLVLVLFSVVLFLALNSSANADEVTLPKVVYVRSGDTIWSIAEKFAIDRDIREVVYEIRQDNQLESADIQLGQRLLIRQ